MSLLCLCIVSVCGACTSIDSPVTSTRLRANDGITAVHKYVAERKGWKRSEYRVEINRQEGRCIVFDVLFLADLERHYPGGGDSVELYYDVDRHAIVQELGGE